MTTSPKLVFGLIALLLCLLVLTIFAEAGARSTDRTSKTHKRPCALKKISLSSKGHESRHGKDKDMRHAPLAQHRKHTTKKEGSRDKAELNGSADDRPKKHKKKKTGKTGRGSKGDRLNHSFGIVDITCGAGKDVLLCPEDRPCCSRWGYCGADGDYCLEGCQQTFGQCGLDRTPFHLPSSQHKHRSRSGFDLQERKRSLPNQDGQKFRIPASVSKLPPNGTLINIAYFPGWTQYRGQGRNSCHQRPYLPSSIPWASLDYVMFAFAYFDEDYQLYPADPSDENLYFTINSLKLATKTRVMLSVGGWGFTHPESRSDEDTRHRFENMVRMAESRTAFINSCIEFCQFYGFDGIDIDYEYPTYDDREFVTALFREMRDAFDREGSGLVLSLAGASFVEGIQGYELDKVSMYTDFLMIMAYDLYTAYDLSHTVNIHTTLVQMPTEIHGGHSVQGAVEFYLDRGVPRQKLVLGMALYGKSFILTDPQQSTPGQAKFISGGDPTRCIETRGDIAFNEIANLIHPSGEQTAQITPLWDSNAKAFYFVYGDRHNWVGYDDRPSLDLKLQMATELNLAGVMWWSLDQDLDSTSEESAFYKQWHTQHKSKPTTPQIPFQAPVLDATHVKDHLEIKADSSSRTKPKVAPAPATQKEAFYAQDYPVDCPPIGVPPASMTTISPDSLGRPGLVPYVASKKNRCLAVTKEHQALPDTPVGNMVLVRCSGPAGCIDTWQAYTCNPEGWSTPSACYERRLLSPSLYFYGELELVRAAGRDRNVVDASAGHGLSRASYKLSTQVGPNRPEYITQFLQLAAAMEKVVQKTKEKKEKKEKKQLKADNGGYRSLKKKPRRKPKVKSQRKQHV